MEEGRRVAPFQSLHTPRVGSWTQISSRGESGHMFTSPALPTHACTAKTPPLPVEAAGVRGTDMRWGTPWAVLCEPVSMRPRQGGGGVGSDKPVQGVFDTPPDRSPDPSAQVRTHQETPAGAPTLLSAQPSSHPHLAPSAPPSPLKSSTPRTISQPGLGTGTAVGHIFSSQLCLAAMPWEEGQDGEGSSMEEGEDMGFEEVKARNKCPSSLPSQASTGPRGGLGPGQRPARQATPLYLSAFHTDT